MEVAGGGVGWKWQAKGLHWSPKGQDAHRWDEDGGVT